MKPKHDETSDDGWVPHEEFRQGLPQGRFHVIVNPSLAPAFVAHRVHATPLAVAIIGPGIALALAGHPVWGALLVAAGVLLRRMVKTQAGPLLLHLAAAVPSVYEQATAHGVMEVQRR